MGGGDKKLVGWEGKKIHGCEEKCMWDAMW
jgi:hypothetical protein